MKNSPAPTPMFKILKNCKFLIIWFFFVWNIAPISSDEPHHPYYCSVHGGFRRCFCKTNRASNFPCFRYRALVVHEQICEPAQTNMKQYFCSKSKVEDSYGSGGCELESVLTNSASGDTMGHGYASRKIRMRRKKSLEN